MTQAHLYLHTGALATPDGQFLPGALSGLFALLHDRRPILHLWGPQLPDAAATLLTQQGVGTTTLTALPAQPELPALVAVPQGILPDTTAKVIVTDTPQAWTELLQATPRRGRMAEVHRQTSETDIRVVLNLDGSGRGNIHTGLGFYDHMLDQLARHGGLDLEIQVQGDLHIDEHHTIEDTALALGEAFKQALGDKRGIYRYGFCLPMDDSLAQVAIDFGGRPWIVWQARFSREKIGDMPTEMFFHFFKSFSDAAACNLNMQVEGDNEHHKIEALFKAWAKAIKMAITWDPHSNAIPSTKGVI